MKIPPLSSLERNLRHCLLLKGDDLFFTVDGSEGVILRNSFLGLNVEGLADENLSEEDIASIDLNRFAIAGRLRRLHRMLEGRHLSLAKPDQPDAETARTEELEFIEHFLSTLPDVALGGVDLTSARNGDVKKTYDLAYAWLNLIETIEASFAGGAESALTVSDLALLSDLNPRTLRNNCGPEKLIRTSAKREAKNRGSASPAFVSLHPLDAIDWLRGRKDFEIEPIDPAWVAAGIANVTPTSASRGLLVAAIVNLGSLATIIPELGASTAEARSWFDDGKEMPPSIKSSLSKWLGIER